jgi:hypothetical protein
VNYPSIIFIELENLHVTCTTFFYYVVPEETINSSFFANSTSSVFINWIACLLYVSRFPSRNPHTNVKQTCVHIMFTQLSHGPWHWCGIDQHNHPKCTTTTKHSIRLTLLVRKLYYKNVSSREKQIFLEQWICHLVMSKANTLTA